MNDDHDHEDDDDERFSFTESDESSRRPSVGTSYHGKNTNTVTHSQEMVRITGKYDWFDSSAPIDEFDETETRNPSSSTPRSAVENVRGRKFLRKFLPSKILQRRQALLRRLRQAKDFSWALTAIVFIPIGLILPPLVRQRSHTHTLAQSSMAQWTILVALILALCTALGLNRFLYRTRAGLFIDHLFVCMRISIIAIEIL